MPYDRTIAGSGPATEGFDGAAIDLGSTDFVVGNDVKAIIVITAGNVVCRPVGASADITLTSVPAGFRLPWHCSHIRKTNTTAALATVIG